MCASWISGCSSRQAELKTKADAERYVEQVREKIQQSFGTWPERTPLKPRVTGVVERDAYRIEKIIFESRPQFFVTANLYLPKGAKFPAPACWACAAIRTTAKPTPRTRRFHNVW